MIKEEKRFTITCDRCKVSAKYWAEREYDLPKGWKRESHYCSDSYCSGGHKTDICPGCGNKPKA